MGQKDIQEEIDKLTSPLVPLLISLWGKQNDSKLKIAMVSLIHLPYLSKWKQGSYKCTLSGLQVKVQLSQDTSPSGSKSEQFWLKCNLLGWYLEWYLVFCGALKISNPNDV